MNEDELRAALRHGDGESPDVDAVLEVARAASARRRVRLASTAASVGVVAAVAVTVGVLAGRGGGSSHQAGPAGGTTPTTARPTGSGSPEPGRIATTSPTTTGTSESTPALACPSNLNFGAVKAIGPPFIHATGTRGILVCAYGDTARSASVRPARLVLTGSDEQRLLDTLNAAPTNRPHVMCPDYRVADDHVFAFVGLNADFLLTTLGGPTCAVTVESDPDIGTRYAWAPPDDIARKILALQPTR